jgi:death on curing protein
VQPRFLSAKIVLRIHDDQITEHGGSRDMRDFGLFDSALAQPRAQFGGEYLHSSIYLMAASYGFHLCQNHPFADGNKRTAFGAMMMFLKLNGFDFLVTEEDAYRAMMQVATGQMDKEHLAYWLEHVAYTPGDE